MKDILVNEKCWKAVAPPLTPTPTEPAPQGMTSPVTTPDVDPEVFELAHAEIMLHLTNDIARQVVKISDPRSLWLALIRRICFL